MGRMTLLLAVLAACGCARTDPKAGSQALPNATPIEIKGDRVGLMTLEQFREKHKDDGCSPVDASDKFGWVKGTKRMMAATLCDRDAPVTFANHKCDSILYLFFDGVLESIIVTPSAPVGDLFRHALTSEYGAPVPGTGDLGKPTDNWSGGTTRLRMDRETGAFIVFDQSVHERRLAASTEAARKDL